LTSTRNSIGERDPYFDGDG